MRVNHVGAEVARSFLGGARERGQVDRQHESADATRAADQTAAIRQPLDERGAVTEPVHLDACDRVDRRQTLVMRRQHRDVQPCFLFCVGQIKEERRNVISRVTRERRRQMKHSHAQQRNGWDTKCPTRAPVAQSPETARV